MALTAKQKKSLDMAMASKKDADALVTAMATDATLSADQLKRLEIALGDKKAAADAAAAIDASSGSITERTRGTLQEAMASKADGDALKAEIVG